MRALLDVNFLIALLDEHHTSHSAAIGWFSENARAGWASCPITQNGCIRILGNPRYSGGALPPSQVAQRLREAAGTDLHEFWPDEISLLDGKYVDMTRVHGPQQLTDVYLLALAAHRKGRLVTFDRSIAIDAVTAATRRNLLML
jgi:toxin-antitoxin system PIN domain toxin